MLHDASHSATDQDRAALGNASSNVEGDIGQCRPRV
jgi:hypothetical protein